VTNCVIVGVRVRKILHWESEEEGISLSVDLDSTFCGTRLPDDSAVLGEAGGRTFVEEVHGSTFPTSRAACGLRSGTSQNR
jgi:hypothetical protein